MLLYHLQRHLLLLHLDVFRGNLVTFLTHKHIANIIRIPFFPHQTSRNTTMVAHAAVVAYSAVLKVIVPHRTLRLCKGEFSAVNAVDVSFLVTAAGHADGSAEVAASAPEAEVVHHQSVKILFIF